MPYPTHPITYRQETASAVFKLLLQGESCVLVGAASVSKSNFLHFLLREDVRAHYLGEEDGRTLLLYVDLNRCNAAEEWAYCELILNALVIECQRLNFLPETVLTLSDLHKEVALSKDRLLAQRYLERASWVLCGQHGWRLAIIFDEADAFYGTSDAQFLCNLRAMRDDDKYNLCFVLVTRQPLDRLRSPDDAGNTEAFDELFTRNTVGLRPYQRDDAARMLAQLEARKKAPLTSDQRQAILDLSGGHPGLLSALFDLFAREPGSIASALPGDSLADNGVAIECVKIWESLGEDEQLALQQMNAAIQPLSDARHLLEIKGIATAQADNTFNIFSPLFQQYVQSCASQGISNFCIDEDDKSVLVGGRRIRGLSPLELDLVKFLFKNRGKVQSRDDILEALYGAADYAAGIQDNRVDNLIRRVRTSIEIDPGNPRYIQTIRGHGYLLAGDGKQETH